MVRSGREPPVFMAGGRTGTLAGWSGDGKMLGRTEEERQVKRKWSEKSRNQSFVSASFLPSISLQLYSAAYLIPGTSQDRGREEDEDS